MSKNQKKNILNKSIIVIFICIQNFFCFRINQIGNNGRMLQEDNNSKFLTKKNEIETQTATEFALNLLKLPQFELDERPNIPALQKSYNEEKREVEENPKKKKIEEKKAEKINEDKKPEEIKNPSVDDILNSNPMFQKRFGKKNNLEDLINNNPMFQKSEGKGNDIVSQVENNPMFKKSPKNSGNKYQQSMEQKVAEMNKRRDMQLKESLEEKERLAKDPNAKPRPSKLKQKDQMKELYSVYNEYLKNDPSIDVNTELEPENLFELYQNYLNEEIMKKSSYKKHMKDAADFFGYEDLAKEFEEKPKKKESKQENIEDEKNDIEEETESLIETLKKVEESEDSENSEENFESLLN